MKASKKRFKNSIAYTGWKKKDERQSGKYANRMEIKKKKLKYTDRKICNTLRRPLKRAIFTRMRQAGRCDG